jgi:hypothetical protein
MATQSTATSSEGKNPVTKSPRQKITEEVLPKVNPDVPLRPATNNDPNKPVDAKALNEVAAANSNHGIQRPPGTPERPSAAYWASKGITEPTVPGAVDPNSQAYAEAQRANYQKLMAQGPTAEDRLLMRGVDQNVSRGQMPVGRVPGATASPVPTGPTGTSASRPAGSATPASLSWEAYDKDIGNKLSPEDRKLYQSLSQAKKTELYNKWKEQQVKKNPSLLTASTGPTASTVPAGALPSGGSPIPTTQVSPPGRDEKMLEVLRDPAADPQARSQASTYLKVKTMYAQKAKFGKEIKALERASRAYTRQLSNMFKNSLNRRDPKYQQQYEHWRALRKGDPQAKLIMFNELLKRPEFASLSFK